MRSRQNEIIKLADGLTFRQLIGALTDFIGFDYKAVHRDGILNAFHTHTKTLKGTNEYVVAGNLHDLHGASGFTAVNEALGQSCSRTYRVDGLKQHAMKGVIPSREDFALGKVFDANPVVKYSLLKNISELDNLFTEANPSIRDFNNFIIPLVEAGVLPHGGKAELVLRQIEALILIRDKQQSKLLKVNETERINIQNIIDKSNEQIKKIFNVSKNEIHDSMALNALGTPELAFQQFTFDLAMRQYAMSKGARDFPKPHEIKRGVKEVNAIFKTKEFQNFYEGKFNSEVQRFIG